MDIMNHNNRIRGGCKPTQTGRLRYGFLLA
jgi:hypothetical protein